MAELKNLIVEGDSRLIGDTNAGKITASSIVKSGGTSSQFLKADGSVDSTAYTTNTGTVTSVSAGAGLSISGTASVNPTVNVASGYKLPTTTEWTNATPFEKGTGTNSVQQKGTGAIASGPFSHAEGYLTRAVGRGSHAEGIEYNDIGTAAEAEAAHAEGAGVVVKGQAAHGEGVLNVAGRTQEEAVAALTDFPNLGGTTEQKVSKLIGFGSHVEGATNKALGSSSHAEGYSTQALVNSTHAEGDSTTASGEAAHSEGYNTTSSGNQAHAEGKNTTANGVSSHAEGESTTASGINSHAEGFRTYAYGATSHTEGYYTVANNNVEHAEGQYNKSNTGNSDAQKTVHSIGIGGNNSTRKNAFEVMKNGDIYVKGVGGYDGMNTNTTGVNTVQYVIKNHTHTTTIAAGTSGDTSQITLANGGKYKLTAGGTDYVFTMPAGASSDVYYVTYDTTTYDECKTAFDAGKVLVCKMADEYDNEMMMVGTYKWEGGIFTFSSFNGTDKRLCYVTLDNTNWSTLGYISLEHTGNKVSSITSSNISSTTYYPSNGAITSYVAGAVAGRYQCTKKSSTGNISAVYCANGNIICVPTNSSTLTGTFVMTLDNFYSAFMKSIGGYTSIKGANSAADKVVELSGVMANSTIVKMHSGGSGNCTRYQFSYLSVTGSAGAPSNFTYGSSSSGCRIYVSSSSDVTITLV